MAQNKDKVLLMCEKEITSIKENVKLQRAVIKKLDNTMKYYEKRTEMLSSEADRYEDVIRAKKRLIKNYLKVYLDEVDTPDGIDLFGDINRIIDFTCDIVSLMRYIAIKKPSSYKDVIRQAYALSEKEVPMYCFYASDYFAFSSIEEDELMKLNLPYSIESFRYCNSLDRITGINRNVAYIEQELDEEEDCHRINILKRIQKKLLGLPISDRMIHIHHKNKSVEVKNLDEIVLHKLAGKKARIELMDNKKVIGYLGSDFQDDDGNDCVSIFEDCDEANQFLTDYNMYKYENILRIDVINFFVYDKNFSFKVPSKRKEYN